MLKNNFMLKIKDLIEKLKQFDPELPVVTRGGIEGDEYSFVIENQLEIIKLHKRKENTESHYGECVSSCEYDSWNNPADPELSGKDLEREINFKKEWLDEVEEEEFEALWV